MGRHGPLGGERPAHPDPNRLSLAVVDLGDAPRIGEGVDDEQTPPAGLGERCRRSRRLVGAGVEHFHPDVVDVNGDADLNIGPRVNHGIGHQLAGHQGQTLSHDIVIDARVVESRLHELPGLAGAQERRWKNRNVTLGFKGTNH